MRSRLYRQFNPLTYIGRREHLPNVVDITMHSMQIIQYELENLKAIWEDVLINPDVPDFVWVGFHGSQEIIGRGIKATARALPGLKRILSE